MPESFMDYILFFFYFDFDFEDFEDLEDFDDEEELELELFFDFGIFIQIKRKYLNYL